jgi:tetratricopeptide (TPR) repeat protein
MGPDRGPEACPLVEPLALSASVAPDLTDLLAEGLERIHRGDLDRARALFERASVLDARDARARYGLLLSHALSREWRAAVLDLGALLDLEPDAALETLEVAEVFESPEAFLASRDGLAAWTRWHFHEVDAQIVAAWLGAATGERDGARRHLRSALRFAPDHPVATRLAARLDARLDARPDASPDRPDVPPDSRTPEPLPREPGPGARAGSVAKTGG